ncbi:MAG: hypothetical protein GX244_01035 [Firmicutes bacterium]|nr:hypothetical protein [Bacillota bacterium]
MFIKVVFYLFVANLIWLAISEPVLSLNKFDNYSYFFNRFPGLRKGKVK